MALICTKKTKKKPETKEGSDSNTMNLCHNITFHWGVGPTCPPLLLLLLLDLLDARPDTRRDFWDRGMLAVYTCLSGPEPAENETLHRPARARFMHTFFSWPTTTRRR